MSVLLKPLLQHLKLLVGNQIISGSRIRHQQPHQTAFLDGLRARPVPRRIGEVLLGEDPLRGRRIGAPAAQEVELFIVEDALRLGTLAAGDYFLGEGVAVEHLARGRAGVLLCGSHGWRIRD